MAQGPVVDEQGVARKRERDRATPRLLHAGELDGLGATVGGEVLDESRAPLIGMNHGIPRAQRYRVQIGCVRVRPAPELITKLSCAGHHPGGMSVEGRVRDAETNAFPLRREDAIGRCLRLVRPNSLPQPRWVESFARDDRVLRQRSLARRLRSTARLLRHQFAQLGERISPGKARFSHLGQRERKHPCAADECDDRGSGCHPAPRNDAAAGGDAEPHTHRPAAKDALQQIWGGCGVGGWQAPQRRCQVTRILSHRAPPSMRRSRDIARSRRTREATTLMLSISAISECEYPSIYFKTKTLRSETG